LPGAERITPEPTVVRGQLSLRPTADGSRQELVDALGRQVMDLKPGANDVSRLAPGVNYVRTDWGGSRAAVKVVLAV
jgi:hypothetical protein